MGSSAVDRLRHFAHQSVGRACLFGVLAIVTLSVGLSAYPALAARSAALSFSLMASILVLSAWRAPLKHYRRREVWYLLDGRLDQDLPPERMQSLVSTVMRDTFLYYAERAAWAALASWLLVLAA